MTKYGKAKQEFISNRINEIRSNGGTDATRIATQEWRNSPEKIHAEWGHIKCDEATPYESNWLDAEDVGSLDI